MKVVTPLLDDKSKIAKYFHALIIESVLCRLFRLSGVLGEFIFIYKYMHSLHLFYSSFIGTLSCTFA